MEMMNVNKHEFINCLSEKCDLSVDKCEVVNNIFENNCFLLKKNRDTVIKKIIDQIQVNNAEAIKIYNEANNIIKNEIKNKIKHPFGK